MMVCWAYTNCHEWGSILSVFCHCTSAFRYCVDACDARRSTLGHGHATYRLSPGVARRASNRRFSAVRLFVRRRLYFRRFAADAPALDSACPLPDLRGGASATAAHRRFMKVSQSLSALAAQMSRLEGELSHLLSLTGVAVPPLLPLAFPVMVTLVPSLPVILPLLMVNPPCPCLVCMTGFGPPELRPQPQSPACPADREHNLEVAKTQDVVTLRLTLACEYAASELWSRVSSSPALLPGALLPPELAKRVLRTFAACTYSSEVTCLFTAPSSCKENLLRASLPVGSFVMVRSRQKLPHAVRWVSRLSRATS